MIDFARLKVDAAIRCTSCGHTRKVKAADLGDAFGWGERIARARARLRCQECGHRGARIAPVPPID